MGSGNVKIKVIMYCKERLDCYEKYNETLVVFDKHGCQYLSANDEIMRSVIF